MNTNDYLTYFTSQLGEEYVKHLSGLTEEQFYHCPTDETCHIAFHAWHYVRTVDNIVNFVCQDRKPTVWIRQELNEKWNLPKAAQGTGMERAEARALHVPSVDAFVQYTRDVFDDILPYLKSASESDLQTVQKVQILGEISRLQMIGQSVITHGNQHLGQIQVMRAIQGLPGGEI